MATYTLINNTTLSTSASSVTFSSIPSTYTDLVLQLSTRSDRAAAFDVLALRFNGSSATNYSYLALRGDSETASSFTSSANDLLRVSYTDASTATANTFASAQIYIPNYTSTNNKSVSSDGVSENNGNAGGDANQTFFASLWSLTNSITSITILPVFGTNWVAYSTFYLYGISNA